MSAAIPTNAETELFLFRCFANLPDPRLKRAGRRPLMTILFIVLCAAISGADTSSRWRGVTKFREGTGRMPKIR